jgi:hypothetical protein
MSTISDENDKLFENIYKRTYNSQFLSKEICRKCFDTVNQIGYSTDEQVRWTYEDVLELVIDILKNNKDGLLKNGKQD